MPWRKIWEKKGWEQKETKLQSSNSANRTTYRTKSWPKLSLKDGMENRRECYRYFGKGASSTLQSSRRKQKASTPMMVKRMHSETWFLGRHSERWWAPWSTSSMRRLYSSTMGRCLELLWIDHQNATLKLQERGSNTAGDVQKKSIVACLLQTKEQRQL